MRRFLLLLLVCAVSVYAQTASFPTSVPSATDLLTARDRAATTLSSGIDASTLTVPVSSGARFYADMLITIDNEQMKVGSVAGNTITIASGGRGWNGTTAASHASEASVRGQIGAWYHNRLSTEVQAIASVLKGSTNAQLSTVHGGPTWASQTTNWASFAVNVNSYPSNSYFGAGTVGLPEAFRASINIPSTSTAANHGAAVAGYALSASTTQGAVGGFFFGGPKADGVQAWSLNTVTGNCNNAFTCGAGTGAQNTTIYGYEMDIGLFTLSGGSAPNSAMRGLYIIGGGNTDTPNPTFNAIDVESPGYAQTPKVKWRNAFYTNDGAATRGVNIGASAVGNGNGSQILALRGTSSGGSAMESQILMDSSGNLLLNPGLAGTNIAFGDGGGNYPMQVRSGGVTLGANMALRLGTVTFANLATYLPGAGEMALCTNCTPASSPCTGGGSGALAVNQSGAYKCF